MNLFQLEQWEIWYTFSTYFKTHTSNLEIVAKLLVDLKIADCSILSNGETFCRTNDGIISGQTVLKLSGDLKRVSAEFKPSSTEAQEFTRYARETWLVGVQFLFGEARQISQGRELPTPHLRAFLKPIRLVKKEERISILYPVIILYKSGVLLIEFRMISGACQVCKGSRNSTL